MNKYFTKEYIKECNCEKIQKLIPKLKTFDYVSTNIPTVDNKICLMNTEFKALSLEESKYGMEFFQSFKREEFIWLPTGDQLDEEIIGICKKKKILEYHFNLIDRIRGIANGEWKYIACCSGGLTSNWEDNPLIAKIKLLKKLLK